MDKRQRPAVTIGLALALIALFAPQAPAQQRDVCCPFYDKTSEKVLTGTVESLQRRQGPAGRHFYLTLEANGERYLVRLGPAKFVKKTKVSFDEGERVTVTCAPVSSWTAGTDGNIEAVAREIQQEDRTFSFRDHDGRPLWAPGSPETT